MFFFLCELAKPVLNARQILQENLTVWGGCFGMDTEVVRWNEKEMFGKDISLTHFQESTTCFAQEG